MMAACFFPFRLANRRNLVPRYVALVWPAAWAHSTRSARSHLLPLPVRPLLRLPALSLFPGLTLAQEQRCLAEGNHAISTPDFRDQVLGCPLTDARDRVEEHNDLRERT